jgi:hypothetical protein
MRLPIDTSKMTVLVIGDAQSVLIYGTDTQKTTADGRPIFKVPVLLSGTGDRTDPTTTVTVSGPLPAIQKGQQIKLRNLSISTWILRDNSGRERHGSTLHADGIEAETKQAR